MEPWRPRALILYIKLVELFDLYKYQRDGHTVQVPK